MNDFLALVRAQLAADMRALPARVTPHGRAAALLGRQVNVDDLRRLARRRLPRAVFDFVDGAAGDEVTARRNRDDFDRVQWQPAALAGAADVELATTVLGERIASPILGAPTGLTGLVHPDGELGIARAVHAAGSVYVVSALAS